MAEHLEIIIRTLIAFASLFLGAKLLGKQTISQMTTFDFITTITLGSITANLAFNISIPMHSVWISFVMFVLIIYIVEYTAMKNRKARKFFAGDPTVIIENGKLLEGNMRKMHYTLDYMNQQLREINIFDVGEVLIAMVEPNGTLTALKKQEFREVTKGDLNLISQPEKHLVPIELMMDGVVISRNLQENNIEEQWLMDQLEKRGVLKKDVMYAVLAPNEKLYVDTYHDFIPHPIDKE
ncbi:DUF421 domain-containing protein [Alkalihalophilus marmarensis]|uniref:DUF421 domain-containing protein n=1 Tax=Alkalihalophilus marmarensis TaxID=521377 RepID=UPI002DBFE656|nr:DUF421 domain-containing protein [Alkalihalophilus marmarensis]MEC2073527.1 DUF421 domain-containing protein [Alkalihalophilus marmarensis]